MEQTVVPKTQSTPSIADRDPQLMMWKTIDKFLDPALVDMLTELSDAEIKAMARHKAFIKFMTTPLYVDYPYSDDALNKHLEGRIVKQNGKEFIRVWNPPVAADEAFQWIKLLRISLGRKGRAELLKAIGRTVVSFGRGFMSGSDDTNDDTQGRPWWKFWGKP